MASLSTASAKAPLKDRGNDLYETPPEAVHALLKAESLPNHIWEPACGPGSIVDVLRCAGHDVLATDLVNYESASQNAHGWDFLSERTLPEGIQAIVTNPPFKNASEFVAHALHLCPKVIMLLRLAFLESQKRSAILDGGHLARVHVFRNRLPMMHRAGQGIVGADRHNSSALAFAWFAWDRNHHGPTELHRISWEAAPAALAEPAGAPAPVMAADLAEPTENASAANSVDLLAKLRGDMRKLPVPRITE